MERIKVGIIEDDSVINESLCMSIKQFPNMELVFNAFSIEQAFEIIDENSFKGINVLLLDIGLPGMDGLTAITHLRVKMSEADIIMLTTYEETEKIFLALSSGACSYVSKKTSLKLIMEAIFTVYRGGSYMSPSIARKIAQHFLNGTKKETVVESSQLTKRQVEILDALSNGLSYKLIAAKLEISIDTVRTHIKKIYRALEVNSKVEAINKFKSDFN